MTATVTGPVARWLLLACTVVGLAAMHTLGHTGSHTDGHHVTGDAAQPAAAVAVVQPAAVPAGQPGAVAPKAAAGHGTFFLASLTATVAGLVDLMTGCSGDGCRHAQPTPEPGRHDLPAWSVCLAVLAGLSVAVLMAWLLISRTPRATEVVPRLTGRRGESRAPPWPRLGLRLAAMSVMRT